MLNQVLITFTVGPNALTLSSYDDAKKADIVRSLARAWIKVGLLVSHRTVHGACAIAEQASLLPQHLRKEWTTLLGDAEKKSRIVVSPISIQTDDPTEVVALVKDYVELLFVDQEAAESYGIPTGQSSRLDAPSRVEICRFDCNPSSRVMLQALDAYTGTVPKGVETALVWECLLLPFAQRNRKLTVVDRYAIKNSSGFFRLLDELNRLNEDQYVVLFSSALGSEPDEVSKAIRAYLKTLKGGSLSEVVIYLVQDFLFLREAHYRYIQFGNDCCFLCDTGLELLEGKNVFRSVPYKFSPIDVVMVSCEGKFRQSHTTKKLTFTRGQGLPTRATTVGG